MLPSWILLLASDIGGTLAGRRLAGVDPSQLSARSRRYVTRLHHRSRHGAEEAARGDKVRCPPGWAWRPGGSAGFGGATQAALPSTGFWANELTLMTRLRPPALF